MAAAASTSTCHVPQPQEDCKPQPKGENTESIGKGSAPSVSAVSKKSSSKSSSSIKAKMKRLELQAAEEKAKIQLDLIQKKLEADLADVEHEKEYSSLGSEEKSRQIEQWLDRSELECANSQATHDNGLLAGALGSLPPAATTTATAGATANGLDPTLAGAPGRSGSPPPAATTRGDPLLASMSEGGLMAMLAEAVKNLSTAALNNQCSNNLLSRMSTPKELPEFGGDALEWLHFRQAYDESTVLCNFSEKENVWRLRRCLRGAAKEAVAALLISSTSPDKIMDTLQLRFGNPDTIIARLLQDIKKLQPLSQEYHRDLVPFSIKVLNFTEAIRALGREEYLKGMDVASTIISKLPAVLVARWADYSFKMITEGTKPRLIILCEFLNQESLKISTTASFIANRPTERAHPHTVLLQNDNTESKCQFCRKSPHKLTECKGFKKALRKVRWQYVSRNRLCYKCLISRHSRENCSAPVCSVDNCGRAHHYLLHYPMNGTHERETDSSKPGPPPETTEPPGAVTTGAGATAAESVTHVSASDKVLLKVVPIRIRGPNGVINTSALLDDGSTVTLVSDQLATRAGLTGRAETLRVNGPWTDDQLVYQTTVMNFELMNLDSKVYSIKARCVSELNLPTQCLSVINCDSYSHLKNLNIKFCNIDMKPEMLIGQDNYHLMVPLKIVLGKSNEPSATLTPLGWCIHGNVRAPPPSARHPSHAIFVIGCADEDPEPAAETERDQLLREIRDEIALSYSVDTLGVAGKPRRNAAEVRAVQQLEDTSQLVDGRWYVGLPWKNTNLTPEEHLPDSYPQALRRLKGIERRMGKDSGFAERYSERIQHLLVNGYAEALDDTHPTPRTWYLPHFGVDNPNKKKLRLVFDAAAKVDGKCINDYLLTGPDLLSSLFGIMLRFRVHKIAVTGDIKDMFLRIKIRPEDRHALRFLWRSSPDDHIKQYVMSSLIFGANCSPFIAQFIKNKNARRYESSLPAAVDAIYNSHYMDDYIQSLPDEPTAIKMVSNISHIHSQGGFEMRNWTSNSAAVLNSMPKETLGSVDVRFKVDQQHEGERTLGLIWYPRSDELGFDVSLKRIPECLINGKEKPTKRIMLKVIMSIFDVFGFLAPFTIQGRIMFQETWRLNISWDHPVPDDIYEKWSAWVELLKVIHNIRIPRCYHMIVRCGEEADWSETAPSSSPHSATTANAPTPRATNCYDKVKVATSATNVGTCDSGYNNLELHVFCDASTKAMCAVAYWRWTENRLTRVAFIASRCRVMPVKPLTMPRSELCAALLAARLGDTILREQNLTPERRYFWCDSTTVLHWIRNNTRSYKTFEANRLGEIDELTRAREWRYVPTAFNVADLATREKFDMVLFQEQWLVGPRFLFYEQPSWPADLVTRTEVNLECVTVVSNSPMDLPVPDPARFSSWLRLKRATACVLRFVDICRGRPGEIDCNMMDRAELLLHKHAQAESFPADLAAIKAKRALPRESKLLTLCPELDEHGVMRVCGRIDAAVDVEPELKRPVILDGRHPVARLIVRYLHEKFAHGNQETVVNLLKQRYWIIRIRPTVKTVVSSCMHCRIRKCKPQVPRMGDLPAARMGHHQRPFTFCGLDLFGPMDVTVGRRREKRYGVLFTCLTVRAVHIELVPSLTTDSLIMAMRRMAARRGWPRHLYSDNGTNLRGADKELRKSMEEVDHKVLTDEAVSHGSDWTFIPPGSPHWGGAWERLIRSVKTSLRVILKERAPRDEVLSTLLTEVENIVNSRPLTHVSVDPGTIETLTPNHFLLGSSNNLPISGCFGNSDLVLRKQWRKAQRLADMFWERWVKEILPDLLPRRKWNAEKAPLKVGDLVLITDPSSPRNLWSRGIIEEVHPGRDGRIRLVDVRTKTGTWRRSAARVAPIVVDKC